MLPKGYGKTEGKEGVMRLDRADLRLFIAIVDTGSITGGAAAAHLALASASVSQPPSGRLPSASMAMS